MKPFRLRTVVICLLIVISIWTVQHVSAFFGDKTLRYRMTVTISTPEGDKVGSAVKEAVRSSEKSILPEQGGVHYGVAKGEAVVVDLGKRGTVFALQAWEYEAQLAFQLLDDNTTHATIAAVEPQHYPRFVFFKNLADPSTVALAYQVQQYDDVDAKGYYHGRKCCHVTDNLQKIFGEGVLIKSVILEKTDEPVTWRIDDILPWLQHVKMVNLTGSRYPRGSSLYETLGGGDFQWGNK
jgi:hypothetical protein